MSPHAVHASTHIASKQRRRNFLKSRNNEHRTGRTRLRRRLDDFDDLSLPQAAPDKDASRRIAQYVETRTTDRHRRAIHTSFVHIHGAETPSVRSAITTGRFQRVFFLVETYLLRPILGDCSSRDVISCVHSPGTLFFSHNMFLVRIAWLRCLPQDKRIIR